MELGRDSRPRTCCVVRCWARIGALVYNWWTLFTRLAIPDKHGEAITTRPLLLHGIARRTSHGHQTTVTITSLHAQARKMQSALQRASAFLERVRATAEQLTRAQRWRLILSWDFPPIPPRKGRRHHRLCHRCALLTAVFRIMEGGNRWISNHRKLTFYANWVILRTRRAHNETRLSRHCPGAASGRLDSLAVVVTVWKTPPFTNTAQRQEGRAVRWH